ncbi:Rho GTPase-activating protein 1 [Hondaea fermentalgiana]|uniref:Rho GTPase-activating protein 1 n=1 Tax=Hondaea fermentalgiana TaxID=2315210 RepID=A0A2R5GLY4_9STRA|nr:Rho GTPase-activating protein 1 [Hondaea fermentalgiana]|eukprot:GBG31912.1 Rho GTPase-activating protein 1 [Hondaea fermentalgiana]
MGLSEANSAEIPRCVEISGPTNFRHNFHATFDTTSVTFAGLPTRWNQQTTLINRQFGIPLRSAPRVEVEGYAARIPAVLVLLRRELIDNGGLRHEGVFRVSANKSTQLHYKTQLDAGQFRGCVSSTDATCMAALIKEWFRALPEPLLQCLPRDLIVSVAARTDNDEQASEELLRRLPEPNQSVFLWLLDLLADTAQYETINRMSIKALGIVLAPNLYTVSPTASPMEVVALMDAAVKAVQLCLRRLIVRVRECKGLRNVQHARFIVGEQDPYVETAIVLASTSELALEAQRRKETLVHGFTEKLFGQDRDLVSLSDAALAKLCIGASKRRRTRTMDHGGTDVSWKDNDVDTWGRDNCMYFRYPGRDPRTSKGPSKSPIRLFVRVMDSEKSGRDREIGMGMMDLEVILSQASVFASASCTLEEGNGTVNFEVCFEPWSPLTMCGTLHVSVQRAVGLRRVATLGVEDPFVLAELHPWGTLARSDTHVDGGREPNWDQVAIAEGSKNPDAAQLMIAYPGLDNAEAAAQGLGLGLRVTIFDEMKLRRNRPMGRAWVDVKDAIVRAVEAANLEGSEPATKSGTGDDKNGIAKVIKLWDCQNGVEPSGELHLRVGFEPAYSVEDQTSTGTPSARGKRKALLIGINYVGQGENELHGCHNDVREMQSMMQQEFKTETVRVLTDEVRARKDDLPTARNIRMGLRWLLEGAEAGDCLFLHYSGHGSQVPDEDGDEEDGRDETLIPVDFNGADPSTYITDDELRSSFFEQVPKGVDLTVVFDCCHSGTLSDAKLLDVPRSRGQQSSSEATSPQDTRSRFLPPCEALVQRMDALKASRTKQATRGASRSRESRISLGSAKTSASRWMESWDLSRAPVNARLEPSASESESASASASESASASGKLDDGGTESASSGEAEGANRNNNGKIDVNRSKDDPSKADGVKRVDVNQDDGPDELDFDDDSSDADRSEREEAHRDLKHPTKASARPATMDAAEESSAASATVITPFCYFGSSFPWHWKGLVLGAFRLKN